MTKHDYDLQVACLPDSVRAQCSKCGKESDEGWFECGCGRVICAGCSTEAQWELEVCSEVCEVDAVLKLKRKARLLRFVEDELKRMEGITPDVSDYATAFGRCQGIAIGLLARIEATK